jgi:hypothetical protein
VNQVVARYIVHVAVAYNSLLQLVLLAYTLQIGPVHGYRFNTYDNVSTRC